MPTSNNNTGFESKEQQRKRMLTNVAIWVIAIIAFTIIRGTNGSSENMVNLSQEGIALHSTSGVGAYMHWTDIDHMEMRENLDYGTLVDGTDARAEKSGVWQNDEFGEYDLYVNPKIKNCVVFYLTEGKTTVINVENAKTTESLFNAAAEMIQD